MNKTMELNNTVVKRLSVDIPYDVHTWLKSEAVGRNTTVKNLVKFILLDIKLSNNLNNYIK